MNQPKLVEIDLSKAKEHECPGIEEGKIYLCLIDNMLFCGRFSRQWYGLHFDNWLPGTVGLQFDAPGTNSSRWQRVWLIENADKLTPYDFLKR